MTNNVRTDPDAIKKNGGSWITLYNTEVRRQRKNQYISFVEPLTSGLSPGPLSSIYNLKRITTVYNVKAWVENQYVASGDYDAGTLDEIMLDTDVSSLRWRDTTITGYLRDYIVVERSGQEAMDYTQVELTFERGRTI